VAPAGEKPWALAVGATALVVACDAAGNASKAVKKKFKIPRS
jgi:hypothetical protein